MASTADNSNSNTNTAGVTNSRLLSNSETLRNQLVVRNLYAPDTEYPLQNDKYNSGVVGAIGTIIEGITPFKSYNLEDTVFGRLVTNPTPLTDVGLIMLGKQFTLNFMSNLAQQALPTIKLSNLFDGNKSTKLFTANKDLRITVKEDDSSFNGFVDRLFFRSVPTPHPAKDYPFTKNPSNDDFIKNSGLAQLSFMYSSVNRNLYKPTKDSRNQVFYDYADKAEVSIKKRSDLIGNYENPIRKYFNFSSNPYISINIASSSKSEEAANKNMVYGLNSVVDQSENDRNENSKPDSSIEYAPNKDYIEFVLGSTSSVSEKDFNKDSENDWISNNTEFKNNNIENNLVWGRDGVDESVTNLINQKGLRGDDITVGEDKFGTVKGVNNFNIQAGLLEYTRNLLNASEGQFVDITRKAYLLNNKLVGFNGAGLWKKNDSAYAKASNFADKGARQHSVLDQYNRFAKAIRFNGNEVYGGNPNSVIFNTVLPRIHPTYDEKTNTVNNRNLMFSIENLAYIIENHGTHGMIDDEWGSNVPLCEIGPFKGRMMWFPPYNIEINETATAKYESTVMIGRNEPMYNYQNSERSATINFTLLVDYPPQLKNYIGTTDAQRQIAEFFAFGGDGYSIPDFQPDVKPKQKTVPDEPSEEPELETSPEIALVFPNDVPRVISGINKEVDDVTTVVDKMWSTWQYNIYPYFISKADASDFGYNKDVFYIPENSLERYEDASGTTRYRFVGGVVPPISQYSAVQVDGNYNENNTNLLNKELFRIFNDEANRKLYSVYVYGGASQLYTEKITTDTEKGSTYNEDLGKRRADAAIILIQRRLKEMFGVSTGAIEVTYDPLHKNGTVGDTLSGQQGATKAGIPLDATVQERSAIIQIRRNTNPVEKKVKTKTSEDIRVEEEQQKQSEAAKQSISKAISECVMKKRGVVDEEGKEIGNTGILHGFASAKGNYFYPVFHSQTPEDFHKRLTFLQQCTRQGAAIRHESAVDKNTGTLRARNSVFGRQPICILRIADFFYTKIIIESVNIDYTDTTWDTNPEGFGMQPMIAKVTLNVKIIGGQSLKGPIDALQNAVAFNYYANSTFTDKGIYKIPSYQEALQEAYWNGVETGIYETKENGKRVRIGTENYETVLKLLSDVNKKPV